MRDVAGVLGNTPAVARSSYLDQQVVGNGFLVAALGDLPADDQSVASARSSGRVNKARWALR